MLMCVCVSVTCQRPRVDTVINGEKLLLRGQSRWGLQFTIMKIRKKNKVQSGIFFIELTHFLGIHQGSTFLVITISDIHRSSSGLFSSISIIRSELNFNEFNPTWINEHLQSWMSWKGSEALDGGNDWNAGWIKHQRRPWTTMHENWFIIDLWHSRNAEHTQMGC